MKYSDILRNEHFNNLAAIVRVAFSAAWHKAHPDVPFWTRLDELNKLKTEQAFRTNLKSFVNAFCALLTELTTADPRLSYTEDDLGWFVQQMDGEHALAVASLFFAWASAPDAMLTPVDVAEMTGTHESNWRNKAAAGDIPGATKKGKQWLLPASVLRARGIIDSIPHMPSGD